MAEVTKDGFLESLRASEVINEKELVDFLKNDQSPDARKLALQFVEAGLLTRWQAKYLLGGRHILHIGNYRLLERLGRHETYGDCFRAVHLQLGRDVRLQVLPAALNKAANRREKFMAKANAVAELDHPNLFHVYDIDQEGGRLVLVSELHPGTHLVDYPVEELSDVDVARIVKQAIMACVEFHRAGVVHGQIDRERIVVTQNDIIKIDHLVLSALDENMVEATPRDDINSVGKIGVELLATTAHTAGPKPKKKLFDLLSWLSTTDEAGLEKIIPKLDEWINVFNSSTSNSISSLNPGITSSVAGPESAPALIPDIVPTSKKPAPASAKNEEPTPAVDLPKKVSPLTLAITIAVGGLLLIGGVAWFAWTISNSGANNNSTRSVASGAAKKPSDKSATKNSKTEQRSDANDDATTPAEEEKLSPVQGDALVSDSELDKMLAQGRTQPKVEGAAKADVATSESSAKSASQPGAPTEPTANPVQTDEKTPTSAKKADPAADESSTNGQTQTAEIVAAKPPGSADKPFENFPTTFDLPAQANTEEVSIGPVVAPAKYLLTAELLAEEAICKAKINFELDRDSSDKQKWIVNFRKRKNDDPIEIATFRFDGSNILFQWLDNAKQDEYTQYLRNCQLKIAAGEKFGALTLRSPIELSGLQISEEEFATKLKTEVSWLPHPDNLVVEIQPFQFGDLAATLVNRTVARRAPGIVTFSEKKNQQFVWLEIQADTRRTLELEMELKINAPGIRSSRGAFKKLVKLGEGLKLKADLTSADLERFKSLTKPEDITWDDWNDSEKRLKSAADDSQALASDTIEMTNLLTNLFEKQIPLVVYFEMNGSRIILAESAASSE